MAEENREQHPQKSDCAAEVSDLGGEKPCMMNEVFDGDFDLRPPPEKTHPDQLKTLSGPV